MARDALLDAVSAPRPACWRLETQSEALTLPLPPQIECICLAIQQSGDRGRLKVFLERVPSHVRSSKDAVLRARALVAFQDANFREMCSILEGHAFDRVVADKAYVKMLKCLLTTWCNLVSRTLKKNFIKIGQYLTLPKRV